MSAVFKLQKIDDNPRFEGFAFDDSRSMFANANIYEDFWPSTTDWEWEAPRLLEHWQPRGVHGNVGYNDYPEIGLAIPAFSRKALWALGSLLEANGEVLPLAPPHEKFAAFNVTTVIAAIDHENSEIEWALDADWAARVSSFSFFPDLLANATIFRPRELPNVVFVTQAFVDVAQRNDLKGMAFRKLWPLDHGEDWRRGRPLLLS